MNEQYTVVEADGNGWYYAFDTNGYCDTTTVDITVNGNTYRLADTESQPPEGARQVQH